MYELVGVRLRSVGPPSARFEDEVIDLQQVESSPESPTNEYQTATVPGVPLRAAPAIILFGRQGVGKSTLIALILSVLLPRRALTIGGMPLRIWDCVRAGDVAHVVLEWRHTVTGARLLMGRVAQWYNHQPSGAPVDLLDAWYSFRPVKSVTVKNFPVVDDPVPSMREFRDRLGEFCRTHAEHPLRYTLNFAEWSAHLTDLGFAVGAYGRQFAYAQPLRNGFASAFRTELDIIELFLGAAVPAVELGKVEQCMHHYAELRSVCRNSDDRTAVNMARETAVMHLVTLAKSAFAAFHSIQRLSQLPEEIGAGAGQRFLRITFNEPQREELIDCVGRIVDHASTHPDPDINQRGFDLLSHAIWEAMSHQVKIEVLVLSRLPSVQWLEVPKGLHSMSSGEQRAAASILSLVLAGWDPERDGDPSHVGTIFLDDALGHVSSRNILDVERRVAAAFGTQLIYITNSCDDNTLGSFPLIVALYSVDDGIVDVRQTRVSCLPSTQAPSPRAPHSSAGQVGAPVNTIDDSALGEVFEVLATPRSGARPGTQSSLAASLTRATRLTASLVARSLVASDGELVFARPEDLLQSGDIVLPKVFEWPDNLRAATAIPATCTALVATDSVVVLRPRSPLRDDEMMFFLLHFRSPAFLAHHASPAGIGYVDPRNLPEMRIPRPDGATLRAIAELAGTAELFEQWRREANEAVQDFFQWRERPVARSHVINSGRLTRQRREAANAVNNLGSRLRATLPYPLAKLWRTVQAAQPDESGYAVVLQCVESTLAYSAALGLAFAAGARLPVRRMHGLARRLERGGMGVTLGDWCAILRELSEDDAARSVPADSLLAQYRHFADRRTADAVDNIARRRNARAHRRGPGVHELQAAFEEARTSAETILASVEWLVDYPIRHVETCQWDSFSQSSKITFRVLMGDHNIVTPEEDATEDVLEVGSLYAVDRFAHHQLLRPFFASQTCGSCGQLSVFVIDQWDPTTQEAEYLALDHPHTIRLQNTRHSLERVRLLPDGQ